MAAPLEGELDPATQAMTDLGVTFYTFRVLTDAYGAAE